MGTGKGRGPVKSKGQLHRKTWGPGYNLKAPEVVGEPTGRPRDRFARRAEGKKKKEGNPKKGKEQ